MTLVGTPVVTLKKKCDISRPYMRAVYCLSVAIDTNNKHCIVCTQTTVCIPLVGQCSCHAYYRFAPIIVVLVILINLVSNHITSTNLFLLLHTTRTIHYIITTTRSIHYRLHYPTALYIRHIHTTANVPLV